MRWWYEHNGETKGPVEDEEIRNLVQQGVLTSSSHILQEGSTQWGTVGEHEAELGITGAPSWGGAATPSPVGGDAYGSQPPSYAGAQPGGPMGPVSDKDFVTALLLSIFLGWIGVDRFYLGYTGLGIAKLAVSIFTCGIGGVIWGIIDIINIATGKMTDSEGRPLRRS